MTAGRISSEYSSRLRRPMCGSGYALPEAIGFSVWATPPQFGGKRYNGDKWPVRRLVVSDGALAVSGEFQQVRSNSVQAVMIREAGVSF
jgi:hypothetical protein